MNKRFLPLLLAASVICGVLSGCGGSTADSSNSAASSGDELPTYDLKMTAGITKDQPHGIAAQWMIDEIEKRSDGRIKITLYDNNTLGTERECAEGTQTGNFDFSIVNMSVMSNFIPEYGVFDLPYIFESQEHADNVFLGEIGQEYLDMCESVNLKGLCTYESGFRCLTNSKRDVRSVEDAKGLKIRVMENDIHVALWQALGADAAPMAWGDAFTAMQQGALDGQENPLVLLETNGVPEINKHATKTEHIYNCTITLMSQKLWNEMSEEDRNLIQEVATESAIKQREICRAEYDRVVKWEQEEMGMTILEVDDKQEWIDATQPVRDEYGAQFADALARIEAAK